MIKEMNDDKKIQTASLGRLEGHQERKISLKDDSNTGIENSNLISSITNSFKIIYPKYLNEKEIERLEVIEKSLLIQSLRKEKNLLKKSYSEFSDAYNVI